MSFQYPPRADLGDLALTAPFDLAKTLRRKPREIAEQLAAALTGTPGVRKAEVAGGGYVNVFLERAPLARDLYAQLRQPAPPARRPGHVIVEHTSINPNKAAHIGHLRNAILGDTFVRILRHRGHDVGRAELHRRHRRPGRGRGGRDSSTWRGKIARRGRGPGRGDRIRLLLLGPLRARWAISTPPIPRASALQAETLHAIEEGGNETARLAELVAARIVDCHLATMERLGIRYDLLAHESDILRLHFWDRAFEQLKATGAIRLETEGKNAGCWVLLAGDGGSGRGQDHRPVQRHRHLYRQGHRLPALEAGPPRPRLPLPAAEDRRRRARRLDDDQRGRRARRAPFGHARDVYNVIDVGQSYPQRVVKAGVAALGHPEAAEGSHHLAYEKVVLSPATARAMGYAVGDEETAVKVSGRKGLGVKADDLVDALVTKARAEIDVREDVREGERRTADERGRAARHRHRRAALLPAEVRPHQDHHLRHGGGPGLHGRDRALRAERGGAGAQHPGQAAGGRTSGLGAGAARPGPGPRVPAGHRGGGEIWAS